MIDDSILSHPAYQLLQPLAQGQAEESGDAKPDLAKVVSALSDLARKATSSGDEAVDDFVWDAWNAVFAIAAETPHEDQSGLVDLMLHLRRTPVSGADGRVLSAQGDGNVWTDLPTFGWVARAIWNFDVRDPSATAKDQTKFNNQSALLARLTTHANRDAQDDPLDYSTYALWALRSAFEEQPSEGGKGDAAAAKNAAVWVRYAGPVLKDMSLAGCTLEESTGTSGDRYETKGWKGFCPERWAVWKAGLEHALQQPETDQEARELMQQAMTLF